MRRKTTIDKSINPGEVPIKRVNKNCGKWNMRIVKKLFQGNDDKIRALELWAGKDKLERSIQHLFLLELSCDINRQPNDQLNVNVKGFWPRRNATAITDLRLRDQAAIKQEEPYIEWIFDNSIIKWGECFWELPRIGTF